MKKTIRGVTLAAVLLTASTTTTADEGQAKTYDGVGKVTPVAFVGDIPNPNEDAYFAATKEEARAALRAKAVRPASNLQPLQLSGQAVQQCGCAMGGPCTVSGCDAGGCAAAPQSYAPACGCESSGCTGGCASQPSYAPACGCESAGCSGGCASQPSYAPACGCESAGCSGGCASMPSIGSSLMGGGGGCASLGGGCDSMLGGGGSKGLAGALGLCGKSGWARHEALLWFVEDRDSPALVSVAPSGVLPRLPTATTVFGDPLSSDLSVGYRGDMGVYLTDNIGVGGRFWWLSDAEDEYSASGNGTGASIGRPFFNTVLDIEDALLVNLDGNFSGSVEASSELKMWAGELYARMNLGSTNYSQLDFIGGYSYVSIEDTLNVTSTSIQSATARTRTFSDTFETENYFQGGQLGFEAVVTNGRWFARSLTKVHLGNMEQWVRIRGQSTDTTPPAPGTSANSGLLALGNQNTWERDEFAFIPELNFKLGYRFRDHVEMSVGYTFMMFDNVALAGDHVDRNIDPSGLNTNGPFGTRPAFSWNEDSMYVHGIDLGVAITF